MNTPFDDASLFQLFWENSSLTPARAQVLREKIAIDAAQPYQAYRPSHTGGVTPLPPTSSRLETVWSQRRSQRQFSVLPLGMAKLSNLLRPFAPSANGRHALSSGGAKYPLQLYAALLNVEAPEAVAGQIVWHHPELHGLVPIGKPSPAWPALAKTIGVDWVRPPAVVFFLIARCECLTAKYGERGGRFMLLEAGAHMLALELEAASQGVGSVAIGAFMDREVLALLGLDPLRHQAVLCHACGEVAA